MLESIVLNVCFLNSVILLNQDAFFFFPVLGKEVEWAKNSDRMFYCHLKAENKILNEHNISWNF